MAVVFIIIPFLMLILINLPWRKDEVDKIALTFSLLFCAVQIVIVPLVPVAFWSTPLTLPFTINIHSLEIDALTRIMLVCIPLVAIGSLLTGMQTIKELKKRFYFINLIILAVIGMNGIVIERNLFSIYVFIEVTSVASFILIASNRERAALESSFKYLLLSAVATMLMLSSMAIFLFAVDNTDFSDIIAAVQLSQQSGSNTQLLIQVALLLFVVGLLIKGGLFPFHWWLPDAYTAAPGEVSILLAGIVTKVCGVYTLLRVMRDIPVFHASITQAILYIGLASIVTGALLAMRQKEFKRMLAYSSLSQVGYIIIAIASGTYVGFIGAALHLFNHTIFKSQLFMNAAAVEQSLGTGKMNQMGGLSKRLPVTSITSLIGFLSAAGIPPLAGFWSKLLIIIGLWSAGYYAAAVIAIVAGVLTLGYFLIMQKKVFFGTLNEKWSQVKESGVAGISYTIIFALITVAAGLFFPYFLYNYFL
jgi:multicomponent Na+:H+ antiporter subunit D